MSNILSQEEIDALLGGLTGGDLQGDDDELSTGAAAPSTAPVSGPRRRCRRGHRRPSGDTHTFEQDD